MRIVNNRIYIARGETPTYDVDVIDVDTGAPFVLPSGYVKPVIEFVVRPSVYNRKEDYVMRCYLDYSAKLAEHNFGDTEIQDYEDVDWNNNYNFTAYNQPQNALFRKRIASGVDEWEYRYYNPNATGTGNSYKWIEYKFNIKFQFPYEATSLMEPKTYKYEVTLFSGEITPAGVSPIIMPPSDGYELTNISLKKPLLEATDFIVGGSLSE